MKLTIWQQFSSNHSASFTLVGIFETPEKANYAKKRLNEIFEEITTWYDEDEERWAYIYALSPIEKALAQTYEIEWDAAIAWFFHTVIIVQDNILVLSTDSQADSGVYPVDLLLEKFGGKIAVDGERIRYEEMRFGTLDITCVAPNKDVADKIIKIYKGSYESIEGTNQFLLKPKRQHLDSYLKTKPQWFSLLAELKAQGCTDIQLSTSDKVVEIDEYDKLYDDLNK